MITPISNYQSNVNFNAMKQMPKLNKNNGKIAPFLNEKKAKLKEFGAKVKNEFNNLDEESKMYLYKSVILLSAITVALAYVGYIVNAVVDKFQSLFE